MKNRVTFQRFGLRWILPFAASFGILFGWATVHATPSVYFWPPFGDSYHNQYPGSNWPCVVGESWGHSIATHVYDDWSGNIYLYYYDVHSGWTTGTPAYWSSMYFVNVKTGSTDVVLAPPATLISTDWTVWRNKWYSYTSPTKEFRVETRMTKGGGGACLAISYGTYRH